MTLFQRTAPRGTLRNLAVCALVALFAGATSAEAREDADIGNPTDNSTWELGDDLMVTGVTSSAPGDIFHVTLKIGGTGVDSDTTTVTANGEFAGVVTSPEPDECHEESVEAIIEVRSAGGKLLDDVDISLESDGGCGGEGGGGP